LQRTYEELKLCCHPDISTHPRCKEGFALLTEAYETLTDRNGKRDSAIAEFVAQAIQREKRRAESSGQGQSSSSGSAAASMAESLAARMKAKLAEQKARQASEKGPSSASGLSAGATSGHPTSLRRMLTARHSVEEPQLPAELLDENDGDSDVEVRRASAKRNANQKKKRRIGTL